MYALSIIWSNMPIFQNQYWIKCTKQWVSLEYYWSWTFEMIIIVLVSLCWFGFPQNVFLNVLELKFNDKIFSDPTCHDSMMKRNELEFENDKKTLWKYIYWLLRTQKYYTYGCWSTKIFLPLCMQPTQCHICIDVNSFMKDTCYRCKYVHWLACHWS